MIEGQPERPKAAPVAALALGAFGGLLGAAAALGGVYLVELRPQSQALVGRIDALEAAGGAERKALADRLASVEATLAAPKPDPTVEISKQIDALQADAKSRADAFAKLQEDVAAPKPDAALAARVAALEAALAEVGAARAAADAALAAANTPKPDAALAARVAALEAASADLGAARATADAALAAANSPKSDARVDALAKGAETLEARVAKLEATVFAPKNETRIAPAEASRAAEPTALAIAALALVARVRAGEPFVAELAALRRAGADPAALASLAPLAETGVPSIAALIRSFVEIEPGLLAALGSPSAPSGVVDALLGEVQGLVKVKAAGEAPPPEGAVARAEAAAKAGNLPSAVAALKSLPDAAQAPAKAWIEAAERRLAAVPAAEGALTRAIADLAKP